MKESPQLLKLSDLEKLGCSIQFEAISSCIEEIAPLTQDNYLETGIDPTIPYYPDWSMYLQYELSDSIVTITARCKGTLIGYLIYLIGPFKHNKSLLYADLDTVFISEAFRTPFLAVKMFKMGQEECEKRGITFFMATSTKRKPIDKLLERQGFVAVETIFWKEIKDG